MAETPYSVGWNMKAKVDYSEINKANEAAGQLMSKLQKLGKMPNSSNTTDSMQKQMHMATAEATKLTDQTKKAADSQANLNDKVKQTANSGRTLKTTSDNLQSVGEHSRTAAGQTNVLSRSIEKVKTIGKGAFQAVSEHVQRFGEHSEATRKKLDRLNESGKRFRNVGYGMLPVSMALGAAFVKGAKDATTLQHRYTIIKNLVKTGGESTAASINNTRKMMQQGRDMSLKYGISQNDIAKGYETLVRRGYRSNQSLAAQKTYLQGSIASGDAYSDVVNHAASAIEQFGLKSTNTAKMTTNTKLAVNQMAYSADLTATSFKDLGEAMKYAGPNAHAANQTLHETVSAVGELSNFGIEGSQAGTSLRQIYTRLLNPPSKGKYVDAMKQLGLKGKDFMDSKNNLMSLQTIFDKINKRTAGMSRTQKGAIYSALFGQQASSAAVVIGSHTKALAGLDKEVQKAQKMDKGKGYVAGLSQKNMKSWQNQLKQFKASVDELGMSFAKSVLPTLTPMVHSLNQMVQAFGKLPKPMKQAIAYGTAFVALSGPLTVGVGSIMSTAAVLGIGASKTGGGLGKLGGKVGKAFLPTAAKDIESAPKFLRPAAGELGELIKGGKFLEGAKGIARRIPWLGTVLSATSLIGINKHNAGSKIGDFGGSVGGMTAGASAGAALGSVIPGLGTAVGGAIGGAVGGIAGSSLGKTVGRWVQKQVPGVKKAVGPVFSSIGKWAGKEWKSLGKFVGGVGSWFKGVGKGFDNKLVKPVAGAFRTVIKTAGKLKAGVAHAIAAPFEFAVGLAHRYIVKPLEKPVTSVLNWIRKKWRSFAKTAGSLWRSIGNVVGKAWRAGIKVVSNVWNSTSRWLGKKWTAFSSTVGKYWANITSPIKRAWHSVTEYIHDLWNGTSSWLGKEWRGLSKTAGNIFSAVGDAIKKPIKSAWDYISNIFGKIGNAVGKITKKVGSVVSGIAKWAGGVTKEGKHTLGAHANGGLITSQHNALVGEAGPELAYTVNGRKARILGAAGPHIAKVNPGERILNAHDTAQVMGGGLGHTLPGYAAGTSTLGRTVSNDKNVKSGLNKVAKDYDTTTKKSKQSLDKFSKNSKDTWNGISKDTKSRSQKIQKNTVGDYDDLQKGSVKQLSQLQSGSNSQWKSILSQTGKRTNNLRKSTVGDFNDMQQGSQKQMNQLQSGVISAAKGTAVGFGKEMGRMKGYAHSAMGGAIGQLNHGISGIDSVLGQFGGNKSVINPIKYAAGSNGRLPEDQLVMVNDAQSGPRQEMVIRGNQALIPHGKDRILHLKKNDQVLNGRQTQTVAASYGIQHFAKGSGVSDSTLQKIADAGQKNPGKSFDNNFNVHIKVAGSQLQKGSTELEKNAASKYGKPWMAAMWQVIEGQMGGTGGVRSEFLKYAMEHFSGKPYLMGGLGPRYYDCSGMVYTALKHFGIDIGRNTVAMQNSNGVTNLGHHRSATRQGDLIIYGHGGGDAGHVGIIDNPVKGTMFNETPPHARVTSIFSPMSMGYDYYRIKNLHDKDNGKRGKASGRLTALAKQELGKSALKSIQKRFADQSMTGGPVPKGDHMHWLEQAGIPHSWWAPISEIINRESNWQVHAQNGKYLGIPQTTAGNLAKAGSDWRSNPITQLRAMKMYIKSRYGTAGKALAFRHRAGWYANGGWAGKASIFGEVAGEPEVAINPKRNTADNLIGQTIDARAKVDKNSPSANFLKSVKSLKTKPSKAKIEPHITINFNGDISDEKTMNKAADKMERKLIDLFEKLNDEFGLDDSVW
ncbi:MAG: phage tail tape measure protein [Lentilactobacillus buchneri]|jgi:TP901 family phage tail tape measure protein|nr:phage tail tape measure protein [Lentilactobacillus buchneri]